MFDDRIKFEEMYRDPIYCSSTLYFIAPKDLFPEKYSDADHITVSVEVLDGYWEARCSVVKYSPTFEGIDYDWNDWDIPYEDIDKLLMLARKALHEKEKK